MITLANPREQQLVLDAITDAPDGYDLGLRVTIDDEDVTERFVEGVWGQVDIPITLDSTIAGYLPRRLDGGEVRLYVTVEGVVIPQLFSAKMEFLSGESLGLTDMLASTPGAYLDGDDAIRIGGEGIEYPGVAPQDIVRGAVLALPYEPSLVWVDTISNLDLDFSSAGEVPGFHPEESWGDVLSMVEDRAGYIYLDTPYRGFRGMIPQPLARGQEVPAARAYNAANMPDWNTPTRTSLRFYDVRVYRYNEDGSLAFETIERIPYHGMRHTPLPGQTLNIALEDDSGLNAQNSRTRAVREAIEQGRALYGGAVTLPGFDPLLSREDRFSVYERYEVEGAPYERLWLAKIVSYQNPFGLDASVTTSSSASDNVENILGRTSSSTTGGVIASTVSYAATILEEDAIRVPSLIVPESALLGASSSVASRGVLDISPPPDSAALAPYWVSGDYIYFDLDKCSWLTIEGDDLVFSTDAPVTIDGDDWVVSEPV